MGLFLRQYCWAQWFHSSEKSCSHSAVASFKYCRKAQSPGYSWMYYIVSQQVSCRQGSCGVVGGHIFSFILSLGCVCVSVCVAGGAVCSWGGFDRGQSFEQPECRGVGLPVPDLPQGEWWWLWIHASRSASLTNLYFKTGYSMTQWADTFPYKESPKMSPRNIAFLYPNTGGTAGVSFVPLYPKILCSPITWRETRPLHFREEKQVQLNPRVQQRTHLCGVRPFRNAANELGHSYTQIHFLSATGFFKEGRRDLN